MNRLPDLLIVACVALLVMSMSALGQTNDRVPDQSPAPSTQRTELPKLIVRSAAKGSWAAVRYTSENVIVPASSYVAEKAVVDVGPKVASSAYRTLASAAEESLRLGRLSLDYVKVKLRQ